MRRFAKPEVYEALEKRGVKYAIRLPGDDSLLRDIEELLTRPVERAQPQAHRVVQGLSLSGSKLEKGKAVSSEGGVPCRGVVSSGGLHCEWIKEGKQAMKMTRLSCHRFRSNQVRLALSLLAYNLGNLWRRLALPRRIENWSLTSLQQQLVKTGGRLVKHPRYYWLPLAEGHLSRRRFGAMLGRIALLPAPAG